MNQKTTIRPTILILAALLISAGLANAQCPAVGADTNCGVVLTILDIGNGRGTCSSTNCISISNNQGPYDGNDDTLVGVVNNSQVPIASLKLTSGNPIFGFDGDGLCAFITCTWPNPTGYEGPGVSFSPISSTMGTVNFNPPIAPGNTAYFSLEAALTSATACTSVINNSVHHALVNGGTGITATFLSNTNLFYTLAQAATLCGFTDWDWQQTITSLPLPSPFFAADDPMKQHPLHAPPGFNDPPPPGYLYQNPPTPAPLPLYYNPFDGELAQNKPDNFRLTFGDGPGDDCLHGGTGASCGGMTAPAGKKIGFTTHLVGLVGAGPGFGIQDTGIGFSWTSDYNGTNGGISVTKSGPVVDPGSGTGGITITMVNDMTSYQYPKSFGVSEINGNSVSSGSPAPPILLGGSQILATSSGLAYSRVTHTFNGTVTITNISSSIIDGPFQIVFDSLTAGVTLTNATSSFGGWPFITVPTVGSLAPGQSASVNTEFRNTSNAIINTSPLIYSGSFN